MGGMGFRPNDPLARAKTLIFSLLTYMAFLELCTTYDENLQMVCLVHELFMREDNGTCPTLLLVWKKTYK